MTDPVDMLLELRERVERLENQRHDDGYWTMIQEVDPSTATILTAEGRRVPIWSMSSRLVVQPVAGDQCLVIRGVAVCGVRPRSVGEDDGDVDLIRDVLRHDRATGDVGLGASPSDFVALAQKVDAEIQRIWTHLGTSFPAGSADGGAGLWSSQVTAAEAAAAAAQPTAAEKVKAQ